jgi:hypothetical protein
LSGAAEDAEAVQTYQNKRDAHCTHICTRPAGHRTAEATGRRCNPFKINSLAGAGRGGRTPTKLPSADFESAASASSAIPALDGLSMSNEASWLKTPGAGKLPRQKLSVFNSIEYRIVPPGPSIGADSGGFGCSRRSRRSGYQWLTAVSGAATSCFFREKTPKDDFKMT